MLTIFSSERTTVGFLCQRTRGVTTPGRAWGIFIDRRCLGWKPPESSRGQHQLPQWQG